MFKILAFCVAISLIFCVSADVDSTAANLRNSFQGFSNSFKASLSLNKLLGSLNTLQSAMGSQFASLTTYNGANCSSVYSTTMFALDGCSLSDGPHSPNGGGSEPYVKFIEHNGIILEVFFGSQGATTCDGPFSGEALLPTDTCLDDAIGPGYDGKVTVGPAAPAVPDNFNGYVLTGFASSSDCLSGSNPVVVEFHPFTNATANCANLIGGSSRMLTCSGGLTSVEDYSGPDCSIYGQTPTNTVYNVTTATLDAATCSPGNRAFTPPGIFSEGLSIRCANTSGKGKKVKKTKPKSLRA